MGSSGRKRPADQMGADSGGTMEDQQRTDKKNKSGRKKKDKKRGKSKDIKGGNGKTNKDGSSSTGTSLETTATAEGIQMAQVLSTFSRMEQSRFEAYRKSAFASDAIAKYVAHCLVHEQHRPVSVGLGNGIPEGKTVRTKILGAERGPYDRDGKASARFRYLRPSAHNRRRLDLSELVAPGQAADITVVVSTLAKAYAQRLVLAARHHALERTNRSKQRREEAAEEGNEDASEEVDEDIAISPEDLLKAHADRQARGQDPGFFLQGRQTRDSRASETALWMADPENQQRYSQSLSVVLAAQERYEKELEEEEKKRDEGNDADAGIDSNEMDVDNNDDKDVEMASTSDSPTKEETLEAEKVESDLEVEEEEDVSEKAMKLFYLHVNQIIARQNGISVVTSDDEEKAKKENEKGQGTHGDTEKSDPSRNERGNQEQDPNPQPTTLETKSPSVPKEGENISNESNPDLKKENDDLPIDTSADATVPTKPPTTEETGTPDENAQDAVREAAEASPSTSDPNNDPVATATAPETESTSDTPKSETGNDQETEKGEAAETSPSTSDPSNDPAATATAPETESTSETAKSETGNDQETKKDDDVIMVDGDGEN